MRLRLESVTKRYGETVAVDNVSLEIHSGEFFFLLGPSGCGKTTTLRMVAGFEHTTAGEIFFGDRPVQNIPPSKRNIGMVFQNYALWPHMSVYKNVEYGLVIRKISEAERKRRVAEALAAVQMTGYEERQPNQLSGGQQQRIALARALVIKPDILLFDEPLSNLDAKLRLEMRDEIRRIQRETQITTLYVTHDQQEALSMADRLAIMSRGKISQMGEPKLVYKKPNSRFIASFIGETNFIDGTVGQVDRDLYFVTTPVGSIKVQKDGVQAATGQKVSISVRPESIRLGRHSDNKDNNFEMKVDGRSFLGDVEQFRLASISGQRLMAIEMNPEINTLNPGTTIRVGFNQDDCVLLVN